MFVDYELPKPVRSNVKAPRSLRKDEHQQKHTQPDEAEYHHFDFSVPRIQMPPINSASITTSHHIFDDVR